VKARNFILTTGAFLALVVPAASHAANGANRLYQTRVHTILAEKAAKAAKTDARFYQTQVHTILADKGITTIQVTPVVKTRR
jgi:hypothetical protein